MRLRILACLPVAALITIIVLLSASSFVSALEGSVSALEASRSARGASGGGFGLPASITIVRPESECDRLQHATIRKIYGQKVHSDPNYNFMDNQELVKAVTDVRLKSDIVPVLEAIAAGVSSSCWEWRPADSWPPWQVLRNRWREPVIRSACS